MQIGTCIFFIFKIKIELILLSQKKEHGKRTGGTKIDRYFQGSF